MKRTLTAVVTAIFLTFVITQNAALTMARVEPVSGGYELEIFGATTIK